MNEKKILIIGMVWPEPTSSAAGTRMIQLIHFFLSSGYSVIFASAASKSDFSFNFKGLDVEEREIKLNDNSVNILLKEIQPNVVLFDRFVMEEQYGWRVDQECPNAIKILDTEDLHFLRAARQQAIKSKTPLDSLDFFNELAKREIASILRCDLSLIISETEMEILQYKFNIHNSLLFYIPFLEDSITEEKSLNWINFEDRNGFVFIGNYIHEPNWSTLQILKTQIWPILRKRIPTAKLHIYGAYSSPKVMQLDNRKENFYVHGRAESALDVLAKARVLLAPIPFGAGIKGKFIDAMHTGTPSVTTSIGAEAMHGDLEWNGAIEDDYGLFIEQAILLHEDKARWLQAQRKGIQIINERYGKQQFSDLYKDRLEQLQLNLKNHRQSNFMGQILQFHMLNSTKYMSLWIEEKNKSK